MMLRKYLSRTMWFCLGGIAGACTLSLTSAAAPVQSGKPAAVPARPASAPAVKQKLFRTPKEAGDAMILAAESFDMKAFAEILGPDAMDLVVTEDTVADKKIASEFAALARAKAVYTPDPKDPKAVNLFSGAAAWPFPIPIVKEGKGWRFDSDSGRQEVHNRRVGRNELTIIQICHGYVEAQKHYAEVDRDGNGVLEYAQRLISSPGKRDGLSWQNPDGTMGGPVGAGIAKALDEGYPMKGEPFHGYYFKVLKRQGPAAPIGEIDYVIKGYMIGGFALVAWPAQYRVTGVKTFVVSHDGVIYQKDLGGDCTELVGAMERYNPDGTWTPVEEAVP